MRLSSRKPARWLPRKDGFDAVLVVGVLLLVVGIVIVSLSFRAGGEGGNADVKLVAREHIVSAAYKAYGNKKLGFWLAKTVVENKGDTPIYSVKISYMIEGFTGWSQPHEYAAVPPGGAVVDLYYPVLPPSIAKLTSATPSKIVVRVEYRPSKNADPVTVTKDEQITVLGINDIVFSSIPPEESTGSFQDIFSNYPLLAAWVTPSDPVVVRYAGMVAQLAGGPATSLSDEEAIKFLSAAWEYSVLNGISYQTESSAYWSGRFSEHIKFPRDVLRDRSGTCIDTAIFFASLAMSQGLEAYIVLMPGHAFPIIKLPSGALVPIESTRLNARVDFNDAVQTGLKVAQMAFAGPHIIVDIATLHAEGIVPPELPELPPNVLEQWGYKPPSVMQQQPHGGGGQGGVGQEGGQGGQGAGEAGGSAVVANTRIPPFWAIEAPPGWQAQIQPLQGQGVTGGTAMIASQQAGAAIIVFWVQGLDVNAMRRAFEDMVSRSLQQQGGGQLVVEHENPNTEFAGEKALMVAYKAGSSLIITRYFVHEGYGFVVAYQLVQPSQDLINSIEEILRTFQWVAGV